MSFCEKCGKLLELVLHENKVVNRCAICREHFKIKGNIFKMYKKKNMTQYKDKVESALYDDILPVVKSKCKSCPNKYLKYFKDEKTLMNIYVCVKCQKYWTGNQDK